MAEPSFRNGSRPAEGRRPGLAAFLDDETGAVTVDWVALTASILLMGLVVVYAVLNTGLAPVVSQMGSKLASVTLEIDPGPPPDCNLLGSCD